MTAKPEKPLIRPGKAFLLLLLGCLVYAISFVVMMPAGWAWSLAAPRINLPPAVSIQAVTGRLWDGGAQMRVMGHTGQLFWDVRSVSPEPPWLHVDWSFRTVKSDLTGDVRVLGKERFEFNAAGRVHVPEFRREIRQAGGALLEGDVRVRRLRVVMDQLKPVTMGGLATWPGGAVTWPMGARLETAQVPPMQMELLERRQQPFLTVSRADRDEPVADAMLQQDGFARIRVYRRMLDLVNQPWSGSQGPGDVIFEVSQPLFPGGL